MAAAELLRVADQKERGTRFKIQSDTKDFFLPLINKASQLRTHSYLQ